MDEAIARAREAVRQLLAGAEYATSGVDVNPDEVVDAFLASLSSQGRVIVPREATRAMRKAAGEVNISGDVWDHHNGFATFTPGEGRLQLDGDGSDKIWDAMLSAAGGGD